MKLFRVYIITAVVCLSITMSISAIFIADENAKRITLGKESTVLVFSSADEKYHSDVFNPMPILEKLGKGAEKAAGIAPPPISNIYWFVVSSERIMNQKQKSYSLQEELSPSQEAQKTSSLRSAEEQTSHNPT